MRRAQSVDILLGLVEAALDVLTGPGVESLLSHFALYRHQLPVPRAPPFLERPIDSTVHAEWIFYGSSACL
jgi:hypothetical protein